jgi:hypothetical protein
MILSRMITDRERLTNPNWSNPILWINRGIVINEIKMFEDWITDIKKKFWIDLFRMICPNGRSESFSNMAGQG